MRNVACCVAVVLLPVCFDEIQAQYDPGAVWAAVESGRDVSRPKLSADPDMTDAQASVVEGLLRLREYERSGDRTDALIGLRAVERAVARAPEDAWAHFALGALLARGPDVREILGEDRAAYVVWEHSLAVKRAPRALRRALELDPSLHEAAQVFAELALDVGTNALLQEAAGAAVARRAGEAAALTAAALGRPRADR